MGTGIQTGPRAALWPIVIGLEEQDWKGFLIGLLRSYVDFRDTTRDAEDEERARAPRLPWYESLTRGFMTARLTIPQEEPEEERVKAWITRSVAPMLAALCALPNGQAWVEGAIVEGRTDSRIVIASSSKREPVEGRCLLHDDSSTHLSRRRTRGRILGARGCRETPPVRLH